MHDYTNRTFNYWAAHYFGPPLSLLQESPILRGRSQMCSSQTAATATAFLRRNVIYDWASLPRMVINSTLKIIQSMYDCFDVAVGL